jgi:predicted transcriptional regulators
MPEDKLKFLGDRIRSARKDCGLTQQALADQADLAVKTIQDVERGRKNTTYETVCALSKLEIHRKKPSGKR